MVSNDIIEQVMSQYEAQLSDIVSYEYRFFYLLISAKAEEYNLFSTIFQDLYDGRYDVQTIKGFLDIFNLELTIENLIRFIDVLSLEVDIFKLNTLRKSLFNNSYKEYGNFNSYVRNLFNTTNNVFFQDLAVDDNLFKDDRSFLLVPNISNYGNNKSYDTFREAEEDYWRLVGLWKTTEDAEDLLLVPFNLDISKKIIGYLLTKRYSNSINGISLLMQKTSQKPGYTSNKVIDQLISSILKEEYKKLSIKEVYYYTDKMLAEIIEWQTGFDYSSSLSLPNVNGFFSYRVPSLTRENLSEIKEIKFYRNLLKEFLQIPDINAGALLNFDNQTNNDFGRINTIINSLRDYLLANGKFEEYR
jgi:hypothetical protein